MFFMETSLSGSLLEAGEDLGAACAVLSLKCLSHSSLRFCIPKYRDIKCLSEAVLSCYYPVILSNFKHAILL